MESKQLESKKSNEKKFNVILDGEQIRDLIVKHQKEFDEFKKNSKEYQRYVKKIMDVNSSTGVSSISINIGEGKKRKVDYSDSNGWFYIQSTPSEHEALKLKLQKEGLAADKTPKITIGIHYDHGQYGACSFSKEYDYIPAGKKAKSGLEGVMLTQKFSQYRTERLEEQRKGLLKEERKANLEEQINELKRKYKELKKLHQQKKFPELNEKLKVGTAFITHRHLELDKAGKYGVEVLPRKDYNEQAYKCTLFNIEQQIENLQRQKQQLQTHNEYNKYNPANTEPNQLQKKVTNRKNPLKPKNLDIIINSPKQIKDPLDPLTLNTEEKKQIKRHEAEKGNQPGTFSGPVTPKFTEESDKKVHTKEANNTSIVKTNPRKVLIYSFKDDPQDSLEMSENGINLSPEKKKNLNISINNIENAKRRINQTTIKQDGSNKSKTNRVEEMIQIQNSKDRKKQKSKQIKPEIKKQIQPNNINSDPKKNKLDELKRQIQTNNRNKDKENNKVENKMVKDIQLEAKETKDLRNDKKEASINLTESNSKKENSKEN